MATDEKQIGKLSLQMGKVVLIRSLLWLNQLIGLKWLQIHFITMNEYLSIGIDINFTISTLTSVHCYVHMPL